MNFSSIELLLVILIRSSKSRGLICNRTYLTETYVLVSSKKFICLELVYLKEYDFRVKELDPVSSWQYQCRFVETIKFSSALSERAFLAGSVLKQKVEDPDLVEAVIGTSKSIKGCIAIFSSKKCWCCFITYLAYVRYYSFIYALENAEILWLVMVGYRF